MSKRFRKLLSFVLVTVMIFSLSVTAFAASFSGEDSEKCFAEFDLPEIKVNAETLAQSTDSVVRENSEYFVKEAQKIHAMDINELNAYIDNEIGKALNKGISVDIQKSPATKVGVNGIVTDLELKALWLAAAQVAKLAGYTCSAKLIEYSVLGISYNETTGSGGLFHDKMVTTNTYTNFLSAIKNGTKQLGVGYVLSHSKSENSDLYYSVHSCTYTATKTGNKYNIAVYDLYDFDISGYDSVFTGLVNNWAWLCQNTGVLNVIDVNISWTA